MIGQKQDASVNGADATESRPILRPQSSFSGNSFTIYANFM